MEAIGKLLISHQWSGDPGLAPEASMNDFFALISKVTASIDALIQLLVRKREQVEEVRWNFPASGLACLGPHENHEAFMDIVFPFARMTFIPVGSGIG
jgi:hypothetical protein